LIIIRSQFFMTKRESMPANSKAQSLLFGILGIVLFGVLMVVRKKMSSDGAVMICAASAFLCGVAGISALMNYVRK